MKTILLSLLLAFDNNPKLTAEEAARLNEQFKSEHFNFNGKYVGFTEVTSGGYWGIGKWTFRLNKSAFFNLAPEKHLYKLHILDSAEKARTNGYDAIIVIADKKVKGKFKRLKRETVIKNNYNRYPQLPADAGLDNNPLLNKPNADFFNELYKYDINPKPVYDFSGKKIAIFASYDRKIEQKSIAEYVQHVKAQLDQWGFSHTEFTYMLTPEQKAESGGYDVIILYRNKKDLPLNAFIEYLRQNSL